MAVIKQPSDRMTMARIKIHDGACVGLRSEFNRAIAALEATEGDERG